MHFNENKSNVLLVTTKLSEDNKTLNIYLNNKLLEQVSELKYLEFILTADLVSTDMKTTLQGNALLL